MTRTRQARSAGWAIVTGIMIGLAAACQSPRREEPIAGPLPAASQEVERGRIAFMKHCHMCHPQGDGGLGPTLNDKPLPAFAIRTQVRVGLGVMPSIPEHHLPRQELDDITAYLAALRKHRPSETR